MILKLEVTTGTHDERTNKSANFHDSNGLHDAKLTRKTGLPGYFPTCKEDDKLDEGSKGEGKNDRGILYLRTLIDIVTMAAICNF